MKSATKKLAWQVGSRVMFAKVTVSVEKSNDGEWRFEVPLDSPAAWAKGALFGAELLRGALQGTPESPHGANVRIDIVGQPIDTTASAVAYATFHALREALGSSVDRVFDFDNATGAFVIRLSDSGG